MLALQDAEFSVIMIPIMENSFRVLGKALIGLFSCINSHDIFILSRIVLVWAILAQKPHSFFHLLQLGFSRSASLFLSPGSLRLFSFFKASTSFSLFCYRPSSSSLFMILKKTKKIDRIFFPIPSTLKLINLNTRQDIKPKKNTSFRFA